MNQISKSVRIGVIAGGFSGEREVSLRSGKNVLRALQNKGYHAFIVDPVTDTLSKDTMDMAFIALHGQFGEDGCIQAYLATLGIPYTGSGVQASVLGMNKLMSKQLMVLHGLPTPAFQVVRHPEAPVCVPFPVVIKPIAEGSSLSVEIIDTPEDYQRIAAPIVEKYGIVLVEEYIQGRELTVGVLEKDGGLMALPILELKPQNRFYDYDAKYTPGKTTFVLPAPMSDTQRKDIETYAIALHTLLGCSGATRTDLLVHPEKGPYLLEINTAPGMTDQSDLPAQAQEAGIDFDTLVEIILYSALKK